MLVLNSSVFEIPVVIFLTWLFMWILSYHFRLILYRSFFEWINQTVSCVHIVLTNGILAKRVIHILELLLDVSYDIFLFLLWVFFYLLLLINEVSLAFYVWHNVWYKCFKTYLFTFLTIEIIDLIINKI